MKVLSFDIGIKNLAFAKLDAETREVLEWDVVDIMKEGSSSKPDFHELTDGLLRVLHDRFADEDADVVLIENQPALVNPVMKSVQMMIYTFFKIKAFHEGTELPVKFVAAAGKLKLAHKDACDLSHITTKDKYRRNKLTSIALCRSFLDLTRETNGRWTGFFDAHKKKDDLADSCGLALHYIETL